jgi:hypothetical protein
MSKISYLVAAALVLATMGVAWQGWRSMADVVVGTAGILAMVFGALLTIGLAVGLVALLFVSNRRGFDDQAGGRPQAKRGGSRAQR